MESIAVTVANRIRTIREELIELASDRKRARALLEDWDMCVKMLSTAERVQGDYSEFSARPTP
jgi:hypothetical protein